MKLTRVKYLLVVVCLIGMPFNMLAAQEYLLTEKIYKALEQAQQQMENKVYRQAESELIKLVDETKSGSYDRAVVLQTLGYLYSETGQYTEAAERFREALELNALPQSVTHNLRYNLAQLLITDGNYQQGIDILNRWLTNAENPDNQVYVLLASAHYQLKQFTKTVEAIRVAIRRENSPPENWYRMQLSAHLEMEQFTSAIEVLEVLLTRYPDKKIYWDQLGALFSKQDKQMTAVAVQALSEKLNLGDDKTLSRLSNMYRYLKIPYKSAKLLEQGIIEGVLNNNFENLQKLADSWLAARETDNAAKVLETLRGMDKTGQTDLKLSRVLVSEERWQAAQQPLQDSLKKLPADQRGEAYLLSGMVQYNLDNYSLAESLLEQALKFDKQRNQASQWLRHVQQIRENLIESDDA